MTRSFIITDDVSFQGAQSSPLVDWRRNKFSRSFGRFSSLLPLWRRGKLRTLAMFVHEQPSIITLLHSLVKPQKSVQSHPSASWFLQESKATPNA